MKLLTIFLIAMFSTLTFATEDTAPTQLKVVKAIANIQSANWILNDLTAAGEVFCKTKDSQELFDMAHKNLGSAAKALKKHLALTTQIDRDLLLGISKNIGDSYRIFKTLIFLNEIVIKTADADLKFEQSRFRQMRGTVNLREYTQNGDDDIFTPLNQRNSAMAAIKILVQAQWRPSIIAIIPKYISQTDLKLINALIKYVAPGSITRHLKAYFTNHSEIPQENNYKGHLGAEIIKNATGWTLETLPTLPPFISKDSFLVAQKIVKTTKRHNIATKLAEFFSSL